MFPVRVLTIALAFALALGGSVMAAEKQIGQIKIASGVVKVLRGDTVIAAERGTPLFAGDTIQTDKASAVGMTFVDNTRMSLGPNSELILRRFDYNEPGREDSFVSELNDGSMTATSGDMVKRRPLSMRVVMPTATLGVRGTQFAARVQRPGA